MDKKQLCLILIPLLVASFLPFTMSETVKAQSPKFDVDFEIAPHMTYTTLYITVQNLQDSPDALSLKTILSDTDFSIYDVANAEFAIQKSEEYQVEIADYGWVQEPVYDNDNVFAGYEDVWKIVGSHSEVRERLVWVSKSLTSKTEDGLKGELKHQWEQVPIAKYGTERFMLTFDHPFVARAGGWGSKGTISLNLNGEIFVDLTNSSWWNESWSYSKKITVDHDKVDGEDLSNFPVMVYLSSDADLAAHALDNGDDIAFVNADNTVQYDHEIEYFDGSTGKLAAYVRIPTLYDATDTVFYMYYGNAGASDQQNPAGVWLANFVMVQHMKDITTSTTEDSTDYNSDGTKKGANEPLEVDGKIYKAQSCDGTDDHLDISDTTTVRLQGDFTMEFWLKVDESKTADVLNKSDITYANYIIQLHNLGLDFYASSDGSTWGTAIDGPDSSLTVGAWYYIAITKSSSSCELFVNMVSQGSDGSPATPATSATPLRFGGKRTVTAYSNVDFDEVRFSNVVKTSGWLTTSLRNENDPSSFYSVGGEVSAAVGPNAPTNLWCEGKTTPTHIIDFTPEFSAIGTDNDGDQMDYYALQVDDDSEFGSPIWNKTKTSITAFDNGDRCSDIEYDGSALSRGVTYYWHIKFWDNNDGEGDWSTETATFKINQLPTIPTSFTDLGMNLTDHTPTITWTEGTDAGGGNNLMYEYYNTNDDGAWTVSESCWVAQTFTTSATHNVTSIKVKLWREDTPSICTIGIWATDGSGHPTGGDLTYTTFNGSDISASPTWYDFSIPENTLSASTKYAIVIRSPTPRLWWRYDGSDPTYTGGNLERSEDGGLSWDSYTSYDLMFEIWGWEVMTYIYLGTTSTPIEADGSTTNETFNLGENASHSCYPLTDGTTYYYRLRSWDGLEWSTSYTAADQFRMNTPPTLATDWTDLGMNLTDSTPTITWTKGTDAEDDTVTTYTYLGTTSTPTEVDASTTAETDDLGENTSHSCYPLTAGPTYYYRLRSWDGYEWSASYTTADEFKLACPPEIISVSVNYSVIDRDIDDAGSGAITSTTITLRVRDYDNRDNIADAWIAVRDNKDTVRENENVFSTATIVDENTLDFTLTVNPGDDIPDNALGYWDVWTYAADAGGATDDNTNENVFTVGDMGTTIVFVPPDPYYHWELSASGTVYRLDGGGASASNVWYKDEVENRIFTFTGTNTWSTNGYTINSQPGENVTIEVIIWDPPLDGIVYENYTVLFENWKYQITLKWGENFLVVTENVENMELYLNFIYTAWETETVQIMENVENFTLSYEPLMVRMWDSKENYHRTYKTDRAKIDIYLVGPEDLVFLKQYHIKLDDPLLVWGPPDGSISIGKFDEDELVFITNSYWTAASDYSPWLVYGEIYYIRLISPTLGTLDYGIFDADLITSRIITPSLQAPAGDVADVLVIFEEIAWSVWCDNENGLNIKYLDNSGGTNWTLATISDENADVVWQENIAGNSWQENWSGASENLFYFISLSIDHDVFKYPDSRLESSRVLIGALSGGIPQPPSASPGPFDVLGEGPVPWGHLFIAGMLIFTLISFGPQEAGVGIIMTGAVAMLLFVVGLAPYGWATASLLMFVGVISMLVERRSDRT